MEPMFRSASLAEITPSVERLLHRMQSHDPATVVHLCGVASYVDAMVQQLNLGPREARDIVTSALLHDIGKLNVSPAVLRAPRALDEDEWRQILLHPESGASIAAYAGERGLSKMIRGHHERIDGRGYPDGLRGSQIPFGSRVIAVADAFDVLTNGRPYRPALSVSDAIEVLVQDAETHFDGELVAVLLKLAPATFTRLDAPPLSRPLLRSTGTEHR